MHGQRRVKILELASKEHDDEVELAKARLQDFNEKCLVAKASAMDLFHRAEQKGEYVADDLAHLPEDVEELENLLVTETARLELTDNTDPLLVERYRKRRQTIEAKEDLLKKNKHELGKIISGIEPIKKEWETALDDKVEHISTKFSRYFEKIKCAGEVVINKTSGNIDDSPLEYSNWGIDLKVKFRDNEELAALTAQRQSGGERSVSIIMYLMALQSFSESPFRVVDEINQGMDPRNERLIHTQIVQTICDADGSSDDRGGQYFLITPKLLPDLDYHENMKVLTVYNSETLPERGEWKSNVAETWSLEQEVN